MCGGFLGKVLDNPITQVISDIVATATGNPELIPLINGGETYAATGNLGKGLESGGLSFAGQELAPAISGELGFDPGSGNSLTDALGLTTGDGSLAGPGTLGGDASNLFNFSPNSGLGSFLGGTANSADNLNSVANGINVATPDANIAADAASPQAGASTLQGYLPTQGSIGAAGGGSGGGGFNIGDIGDPTSVGSSTGIGGGSNIGTFGSNIDNIGSDPLSGVGLGNASNGLNSPGLLSQAINPTDNVGTFNADSFGAPAGASAGNNSLGVPFLNLSGGSSVATNNSNNGILGSLFGNNSNPNQMINGLLRTGIGGLLNNNNSAGYNAQKQAGQQISADYQPFLDAGTQASGLLQSLYGENGNGAQAAAQANWQNTPGYQFALNQGIQATNANAAALGQTLSGNNQRAVQNYGTGLANQTYNNYLQNLQQQAGLGAQAAGGVATGQAGVGNAAYGLGNANATNQNNTAAGVLSSLFPSGGLNLSSLFGGGGNGILNQGSGSSGILQQLFGNG